MAHVVLEVKCSRWIAKSSGGHLHPLRAVRCVTTRSGREHHLNPNMSGNLTTV